MDRENKVYLCPYHGLFVLENLGSSSVSFSLSNRTLMLFFTEKVVKHGHRLPRAGVKSPSLEVLKNHVAVAPEDKV